MAALTITPAASLVTALSETQSYVPDESVAETADLLDTDNLSLPPILAIKNSPIKMATSAEATWLDTSYQKAILQARERLMRGEPPRNAEEWRLPYAPLPARPDLTRTTYLRNKREGNHRKGERRRRRARSQTHPVSATESFASFRSTIPRLPSIRISDDEDGLSTHLPSSRLSASTGKGSQLRGPGNERVYVAISGTATLHPKHLTATDVRERDFEMPQFCYGCRKFMEYTHASHSSSRVYVHYDEQHHQSQPGEHREDDSVNPVLDMSRAVNAVEFPDRGEFCHGCEISDVPHLHLVKSNSLTGEVILVTPDVEKLSNSKDADEEHKDDGSSRPPSVISTPTHLEEFLRNPRVKDIPEMIKKLQTPDEPLHPTTTARQKPPRIPQCVLDMLRNGSVEFRKKMFEDRCVACMDALRQYFPEYFQDKATSDPASSSGFGSSAITSEAWEEEQERQRMRKQLLEERRKLRAEEKEQQKLEELERRKKLYKAPKPFQLKAAERKVTAAKDPFNVDRKVDLPKSKPFEAKKSDKPVTKAVNIKKEKSSWKEPKKFELKEEKQKATIADWQPPPRKERLRPITPPPPPPPPPHEKETKKVIERTVVKDAEMAPKQLSPIPESSKRPEKIKQRPETKVVLPKKENVRKREEKSEKPIKIQKPKPEQSSKVKPSPKKPVDKEPPIKTPKEQQKTEPPVVKRKQSREILKPVVEQKPTEPPKPKRGKSPKPAKLPKPREKPPVVVPKKTKEIAVKFSKPVRELPIKHPTKIEKKRKEKPIRFEEQMQKFEEEFKEPPVLPEPPVEPLVEKEPTPSPPPEPVRIPTPTPTPPPPPKEPTPEPSPTPIIKVQEKTVPRAVERKKRKPRRSNLGRKQPPPKRKTKKTVTAPVKKKREYVTVPIIPYKPPAEVIAPSEKLPTPEPEPEPEPKPVLAPEPDPQVSLPSKPDEPAVMPSVPLPEPALIPDNSNKKPKTPKLPRPVLKKSTPKKLKKVVIKPRQKTTFAPLSLREKRQLSQELPVPEWPEPEQASEPEPQPEVTPELPTLPPKVILTPEVQEQPKELPPAPQVSKQETIIWRRRPEYRPKKYKPPLSSIKQVEPLPPEPEDNTLDYLAKYCIISKSRLPFYQRIFNNYLLEKGIPVTDDYRSTSFTQEKLKMHDSNTSSKTKRSDSTSVTSETPSDVISSNAGASNSAVDDALQSTFADEHTIQEEDEYISPLDIHEEENGTKEEEDEDTDDTEAGDGGSNEDGAGGIGKDARKKIHAKIAVMQLNNSFAADDYRKRLTFDIDEKSQSAEILKERLHNLLGTKNQMVAAVARKEFHEIFQPDWNPQRFDLQAKQKKKKKKNDKQKNGNKTKKKAGDMSKENEDYIVSRSPTTVMRDGVKSHDLNKPTRVEEVVDKVKPDDWIIEQLAQSHWKILSTIPEVSELNLEIERTAEKIREAETQLTELKEEQKLVESHARNLFEKETDHGDPEKIKFRRKQSMIYQRLNPSKEYEVNLFEFERLLQQVNGNLLTERECQFVFHILELPKRYRLNFKLFAVVAALSEKVSRLEPFTRKLINQLDFDALDVKMERAKELFRLLQEEEFSGEVPLRNLAVELEAGGLKHEHIKMVIDKFNREGKGTVDFLDYVTYIPLFIDIHDSIISDPLGNGSTFYAN